ncbi:hypothetical protein CHLRE_16g682305v5 [Chlamydomonas reinhardtii]|uniref:Uncharacterized protein n=1 Tax=Chlamydomonas reinhardtii TaxID=3055 RepID=A0A2K3CV06_CHLRE|nr:uncharacterized protein CHLRE_16g682305v5 [Chlamydomonas reinhardtii]PNW72104.1 hypothetical protein CHLRE_16g682305v5 [Chlamydomonas reinhardtii]
MLRRHGAQQIYGEQQRPGARADQRQRMLASGCWDWCCAMGSIRAAALGTEAQSRAHVPRADAWQLRLAGVQR